MLLLTVATIDNCYYWQLLLLTVATIDSCYYRQLLLEFPTKQRNCFAQTSHFSHSVCRKKIRNISAKHINAKKRIFKFFFCKIVAFFSSHEIPHHFCFPSQNSFSRKNAKFLEKVCELRNFFWRNFAFFAKVFVRWLP